MEPGDQYQRIARVLVIRVLTYGKHSLLEPGVVEGGRALLFDRLVDLDPRTPAEPRPFRSLNRRDLRESVRRELGRLLNTRCPIPPRFLYRRRRSVVDYGAPDFSSFTPGSAKDRERLAFLLARTIQAFEPRLRGVQVEVEYVDKKYRSLHVRIDAVLVVGTIAEPVSFPAVIQRKTGDVEIG